MGVCGFMKCLSAEQVDRIQILRGLAITAVVLIHNTPFGLPQVYCRPFINFAVGLFLFLSGMLSCAEKWNPKKRILKVIIPYIIWTFFYVLLINFRSPAQIPKSFIKYLITAKSAAMMYYIFVYCEFTLLIPFIDKLAKSRYRSLGFLISPLEIIFVRLLPLITGQELNIYIRGIIGVSFVGWFIYFYLGYMLGNGLVKIKISTSKIILLWGASMVLQLLEGYWYLSMGNSNCGTQMKLTSVISGILFAVLSYTYVYSDKKMWMPRFLLILGNYSFGIFFSHMAIMTLLSRIPHYKEVVFYPLNAVIAIFMSLILVILGRKILGRFSKYFAF